jgi:ribulose-phosphate 3-epimerase
MIPIVPAVIPKSEDELLNAVKVMRFSPEIHVDVVDGQFVPFISWPYQPVGNPEIFKNLLDSYTLEVDLMVASPIPAARMWKEAGADMLVFHVETVSLEDFMYISATENCSYGVSALNGTDYSVLKPYLEYADYVQVMGIAEIGTQGQGFDNRVFERIKEIRKDFPNMPITVDGSVNKETIKSLVEAGVDRFICGSAITKAENPEGAFDDLLKLANN